MVVTRTHRPKQVRAYTFDDIQDIGGVFTDILSRVDAISLLTFKRVSKYWHSTIRSKHFAKLQLKHSRENPSFVACPRMDKMMELYSMKPGSFELVELNVIDPVRSHGSMYMISSFNGLICCVNSIAYGNDLQIWICNPCSGETLLLPQGRSSYEFEPSVGVAYGSDISDYRVFRIFSARKNSLVYECEVFSFTTGSWENIGLVPCVPMRTCFSPYKCGHVFVGGKIYWLVSLDDEGEILCVDLEGRFEVMKLPEYSDDLPDEDRITEATYLISLRGSLSLVVLHPRYMDIWDWNEDGENSSWELVCEEDHIPFKNTEVVLAMTSSKNQILCVTETHWCSYDVDTKIWKKRKADSAGFLNPAVFPFTESILPCNGGVML